MDMSRIFNRNGILIDQIRTSVARSYALVSETSAIFNVSVYDSKCNSNTLEYGNILLCENSDGLIPFPGMIDGRGFQDGAAQITCYTPERFFMYRRGPRSLTLTGTAGEIFADMIRYINSQQDTVLAVGDIDSRSGYMQETLTPTSMKNNLARIVSGSGEGYRWRPEVDRGQLIIYGDWFPNMVVDNGLILHDGYNISGQHPLTESPPINDILAYGNGNDWLRRLTATAVDEESLERYGLRQYSESVQTPSLGKLTLVANTRLKQRKAPKANFPLTALNVGGTFEKLEPGARAVLTRLVGEGFSQDGTGYESDKFIILSMGYDPAEGNVPLALWSSND